MIPVGAGLFRGHRLGRIGGRALQVLRQRCHELRRLSTGRVATGSQAVVNRPSQTPLRPLCLVNLGARLSPGPASAKVYTRGYPALRNFGEQRAVPGSF